VYQIAIASSSLAPRTEHQILLQLGAAKVHDKSKGVGGGQLTYILDDQVRRMHAVRAKHVEMQVEEREDRSGGIGLDHLKSIVRVDHAMQCSPWLAAVACPRKERGRYHSNSTICVLPYY
jgi:hypothetical protein